MTISKLTNNIKPLDEVDKINEIIDGVNLSANTSLSNMTNTGKIAITHNAMPSVSKFKNLTVGASGASYTADFDGYVYVQAVAGAASQYIQISSTYIATISRATGAVTLQAFLPVQKGSSFTVNYTTPNINIFRIVPCVGSESEVS